MAAMDDRNLTREDEEFLRKHGDKLSDSVKSAKWTHSPDEGADRDGQTLATRSHVVIRTWAEERGAKPATAPGSEHDEHVGVLRFDFPDYGGDGLEHVGWADWFEAFDQRELVFLYQERKSDGQQSNFFQLVNPRS